jgi:hypothetical protein
MTSTEIIMEITGGLAPFGLADFDLPPPDTKRWVVRRKAIVVAAVRSGGLSIDEVCRRYNLSGISRLAVRDRSLRRSWSTRDAVADLSRHGRPAGCEVICG